MDQYLPLSRLLLYQTKGPTMRKFQFKVRGVFCHEYPQHIFWTPQNLPWFRNMHWWGLSFAGGRSAPLLYPKVESLAACDAFLRLGLAELWLVACLCWILPEYESGLSLEASSDDGWAQSETLHWFWKVIRKAPTPNSPPPQFSDTFPIHFCHY